MSCPLISVIIPVYNRKIEVCRAVESVLNQSFSDFELIVVDDGSGDGASDALRGAFGKRINVISQSNSGVSAARNKGVRHSKGSFIAFLDSDDVWRHDKLLKQADFHANNPDVYISQTEEIWIRKGVRVNPAQKHKKPRGDIFEPSLHLCAVSPSSVIIKKSIFEESRGFDENLPACEDYDLWLRLSVRYQVGLIEEKLLTKYGGHSDQLSSKYTAMDRFRVYSLFKLLFSADLSADRRKQVLEVCFKKMAILMGGLRKRGRDIVPWRELSEKVCGGDISYEEFLVSGQKLFLNNAIFQRS